MSGAEYIVEFGIMKTDTTVSVIHEYIPGTSYWLRQITTGRFL